ncbi:MAG: hypothetical protein ABIQ52_07935 [Vicinamibacterales bacterium]
MTSRTLTGILILVLTAGLAGCDGAGSRSPTAPSTAPLPQTPQTTHMANVTLSVVVYEMTPMGRVPLRGIRVYASEWASGATDANGLFTTTPVWVCPCSFAPWVAAGITQISVEANDPFQDSAVPPSVFYTGHDPVPPGQSWAVRDVMIIGDTRIEVELARR